MRAALTLLTVKKRIRMCGRPAVPKISARPSDTADTGSDTRPPGRMMASCLPCVVTACSNRLFRLKPKRLITMKAMKAQPASSRTALMIWIQVVASMPPKNTYTTISTPTSTTAEV
ncbi:hypothetical protein D3C72_1607290 [compost metagenome]